MAKFEEKSVSELEKLGADDLQKYFEEKKAFELAQAEGKGMSALETKALVSKLEKENLELKENIKALAKSVEGLQTKSKNPEAKKGAIAELIETKSAEIDALRSQNKPLKFELKSQTHGDIVNTSDFADMREGVINKPKRSLDRVQNLFSRIPITKDVYKYAEQTAVVRDGQNVTYNAVPSSTNTAETLTVASIEPKIVKALMDVSTDLIKDFAYMQGRSEKLVNEAVAYQIEKQLITGDGAGANINGLTSVATEFDATDAVNNGGDLHAPVSGIDSANLVDLILSMDMQISVHGEEMDYQADTVVINRADWFASGAMLKDSTGRYLDERVQRESGSVLIDGRLRVVTTNNCPKGTFFVMDSTKGEIVLRDGVSVETAYENGTKWEQELATMKGYARLNLLIANENAGAFQKCTNITTALTAIS